jgi:catechol 2,3-dioxygenase-like lactoylglutathione lyase family enzyme
MNTINRLLVNICSDQLEKSKDFYVGLFDFEVAFDSDWFVQLVSKEKHLELGIISRTHDLVPPDDQQPPTGFYLTFVVEDADTVFRQAQAAGYTVVQAPQDTFYGQRRMLLRDPDGALVDVSSLIK